jgi:hypothetical protein
MVLLPKTRMDACSYRYFKQASCIHPSKYSGQVVKMLKNADLSAGIRPVFCTPPPTAAGQVVPW